MSNINNSSTEKAQAKPMQVGMNSGEVSELIAEIGHSGVANSPADVEQNAQPGPETGEERQTEPPTPIITSS